MALHIAIKNTETIRKLNIILSEFDAAEDSIKLLKIIHSTLWDYINPQYSWKLHNKLKDLKESSAI
jgi:hypothetical protein